MSLFSPSIVPPHPDILVLIADVRGASAVKVLKAVVPFGVTETEIVLFAGVPIGVVSGPAAHYPHIGSLSPGAEIIRLAPTVRSPEPFPPVRQTVFQTALKDLLNHGLSAWHLICEQDCDQHPMPHLEAGTPDAEKALTGLFKFLNGEAGAVCPTFLITATGTPAKSAPPEAHALL